MSAKNKLKISASGSAYARPSTRPPISMIGNFSAHMSAQSLLTSAQKLYPNTTPPPPKGQVFELVGWMDGINWNLFVGGLLCEVSDL